MAKSKSRRSESLPKIEFSGWRDPQKKWKQWVDRLTPKNSQIWEKSGISQAIKASTYKIKRDEAVIVGLSEYWAPSTNSFEFDFGAATITLEDLMGLGGYSVFGEPVSLTVPEKLLGMQCQITQKHKWFYNNTSNRNPSFSCWMSHFMEECEGEEIEHIGFLVLWLSRFVFPSNGDFVSRNVFSIAVHLANETRIALGPAVLASIYRDLRTLSDFVSNGPKGNGLLPCAVYAPMQMVQLWAWEKFVLLSPYVARKTSDGNPLAAKWEGFKSKMTLAEVRSIVLKEEYFKWRCFGFNVECEMWFSSYGKERTRRSSGFDLVGIDCREKYFPHRVWKQFSSMEIDEVDDGIDHLTLYERMKIMKEKPLLLSCDEKSSFSIHKDTNKCVSSDQSQTSAPSPLMVNGLGVAAASAAKNKFSDEEEEDLLIVEDEDEGEGLENRVSKLERGVALIKASLKAEFVRRGML